MAPRIGSTVLVLAALSCVGCGGSQEPAAETQGRRDRALERFWQDFRAASSARAAGDLERAAGLYERALAADSDHGDTLYYLGHFRYGRGETAAAVAHFERLADAEPANLRSWQQLSVARGQSTSGWVGDLAGAEAAAQRALQVVRAESLNYELLARWAAYRGDAALARRHIDTALGHNPKSTAAPLLRDWLDDNAVAGPSSGVSALALAAPHPRYPVDLDGDEVADLTVFRVGDGSLLLVAGTGTARRVLPSALQLDAWAVASEATEFGPFAVPNRAALIRGPYGERLVLVGGGNRPARLYEAAGEVYGEIDTAGLPAPVGAPLVVAADFDGDDIDDLLLANIRLAPDSEALGGRVFLGQADGSFKAGGTDIPGPFVQAVAADVDGDGDADLVVARVGRAKEKGQAAADHAPPVAAGVITTVSILLNEGGRLSEAAIATPLPGGDVRDIVVADLDGDGRTDMFFATGSWSPERSTADVLWLGTDAGFIDASERLGAQRFGATFRAWVATEGLVLVRGGTVPAEPPRTIVLGPAVGIVAHQRHDAPDAVGGSTPSGQNAATTLANGPHRTAVFNDQDHQEVHFP